MQRSTDGAECMATADSGFVRRTRGGSLAATREGGRSSGKGCHRGKALHLAASKGHGAVVLLLLEKGADIAVKDNSRH